MSKPIVMERGVKYRDAIRWPLSRLKTWQQSAKPCCAAGMDENQASSGLYTYPGHQTAMRKNGLHSVCEEASCPNLRNASTTAQQRL